MSTRLGAIGLVARLRSSEIDTRVGRQCFASKPRFQASVFLYSKKHPFCFLDVKCQSWSHQILLLPSFDAASPEVVRVSLAILRSNYTGFKVEELRWISSALHGAFILQSVVHAFYLRSMCSLQCIFEAYSALHLRSASRFSFFYGSSEDNITFYGLGCNVTYVIINFCLTEISMIRFLKLS